MKYLFFVWGLIMGYDVNAQQDHPDHVKAYERTNGKDKVVVVLNLAAPAHEVVISDTDLKEGYQEIFSKTFTSAIHQLQLPAWGYNVFIKKASK